MNRLRISPRLCQDIIVRLQSTTSTSTSLSSDIHIPNKIERGPTDILKALESTISRDYTAPHYKFHDDPYLTPLSRVQNRTFALAKESGKKAAMWIREEHRALFQHKVADPEIEAFVPPPIYTEESKVTEETLLNEISNAHVSNSIMIYDLLKGEVSVSTKLALLELLCFYNNSEPINTELLETRWFQHSEKRVKRNTWISRPQIDTLFEFLKTQEPVVKAAAYNALICGLAKYFHMENAWYLYMESQKDNIILSVEGYNAIISIVPLLAEGNTKPMIMVTEVYRTMAKSGIVPNIHTFNAALSVVASLKDKRIALEFTRTIFADITKCDLKPSLTTYFYTLQILRALDDAAYGSFMKILRSLKEENLIIQDARDLNFFVCAMEMASKQFCNRNAGEMINELLLTGDNYKFIGDAYRENLYYRNYLELILAMEDLETFFKLYNKLVPHVTIPEPTVMKAILKALQLHPADTATQYIPKLWSHMVMFSQLDREELLEDILHLMSVHCKPASDSPLNAQYADNALTVWNHVQTRNAERIQHTTMSSKVVGNIVLLLLRADNFDKTIEIISSLIKSPHLIIGTLTTECINEIFELCLTQTHVPAIFALLDYVISSNLEGAGEMARKLHQTVPLTSNQQNILTTLVGNDVLQLQVSDKN
ncbi:hypothetical protein DMN91_001724 [Ooceraea biroi]|uniref:Small ribosomal subunit protein mS39 n=1 Tax=Ooceraea biroi TaxID=2015173 RepID=A0A026W956_OOCBI|nr:protein PTCD3 homolog, mitochondrial [Ooceraea biroi]EZA52602.1 PTCD3-like protein, mitochondrial [Ooceraea biroi]RLU25567.1 hypothetical protein DMN91_001724 [Ooceraea biroi]